MRRYRAIGVVFACVLVLGARWQFAAVRELSEHPEAIPDSLFVSGLEDAMALARAGESWHACALAARRVPAAFEPERFELELRTLTELGRYVEADSLLAGVTPPRDGREPERFRHYLWRARLNVLAGRPDRARECLAAIDSLSFPSFAPYVQWLRVEANLNGGSPAVAARIAEEQIAGGVYAAMTPDFQLSAIDAYAAAGRVQDALELARSLERRARSPADRAAFVSLGYDLSVRSGRLAAARKTAERLARDHPGGDEAQRVTRDVLQRFPPEELGSEELLTHVPVLLRHADYAGARVLLKILDDRQLGVHQREERSILKARYYYATGDFASAIALARPTYHTPDFRRESMLMLARAHRRAGERRVAADLYVQFAKAYPNHAKAPEALHVAAGFYSALGDRAVAAKTLAALRKSYPSSYYGRAAALASARYLAETREYRQSESLLEQMVEQSRRTDEAAMYYLARVYRRLGRSRDAESLLSEIEKLNPHSFYVNPTIAETYRRPVTSSNGEVELEGEDGLLEWLSRVASARTAAFWKIRLAVEKPGDRSFADEQATACVDRGRTFLDMGFRDWGERELETAARRSMEEPLDLLDLADIYDDYGMAWQSVPLYQRVSDKIPWPERGELEAEFAYLLYPVPFPIQVLQNAVRHDLPPHLAYAMIREESRFDRNAVSRVGALGLMQLMPETGRQAARELEMPEGADESLLDPDVNLALGIWYASSLMEGSGEDHLRMLAAYNAGPSNAKRWFDGHADAASNIDVVDGIDFKETRLYVQRIVESANIYHDLYFDTAGSGEPSDR